MSDPANPNPPVTPAAPILPPEVKSQLDAQAALLASQQATIAQMAEAQMKTEFPNVKDWTLVAGSTIEEKRAHAAKLNAAFAPPTPAPAPAPAPAASANPGDTLNIPPMGAPGGEAAALQAKTQTVQELDAAVKRGDVGAAFDKCVALQPEPYKRVIAGAY